MPVSTGPTNNWAGSEATGARRATWRRRLLACASALLMLTAGSIAARDLDELEHRRWSGSDGGPSQVGALAQTADGYLWLGTNDSLFRFDGLRFVRYATPDGKAPGIVSSLLTVDDRLWVGLRAGGINVISRDAMQRHVTGAKPGAGSDSDVIAGLPAGAIYGMARDRDGTVWAAADDGLAGFDGTRWQRMAGAQNFPGKHARAVFVDRDGILWAANESQLFYRPPGTASFIDAGMNIDWASHIAQAPDGAIWISERYGTDLHRVMLVDGKISRATHAIASSANGLLFDRRGALWISTLGNGLLYVGDPAADKLAVDNPDVDLPSDPSSNPSSTTPHLPTPRTFTVREGLSGNHLWPLLEDREGNVWVGSNAGIDRFHPRELMPGGFPADALNVALVAGDDGSLWAGTSNRPAMRMVGDRIDTMQMPAPVTSAMRDADGSIWMAGPAGIWQTQGDRQVRVAGLPAAATPGSSVRAMARDHQGGLWVSINRLGLFELRDGIWRAMPPPSMRGSQIMPVAASADAQGRLWFGYRDNLLVMRDAQGERRWGDADGMRIGHITAITHQGTRTWVGGQHGAGYIEDDRFHPLPLPDNDLFDNIYAIIAVPGTAAASQETASRTTASRKTASPEPASDGAASTSTSDTSTAARNDAPELWIHAKAGIFQLSAIEIAQVFADSRHTIRYRAHDLMGGLANDPYQVLPLPTAVRADDGRIWFSTSNGVVWLDPAQQPVSKDMVPQVTIESVSADGELLPAAASGAPLLLATDTKRLMFDYTALSLSAPESLSFRYRLDGYDTTWQDVGRQRQAVYTGLNAGNYRFRVIAVNGDGVPSEQEATTAFTIPPVFYRRPLFYVPAAALVVFMLWLLYRVKLRRSADALRVRLEARHHERERIARELHDTLLQGVQGVMLHFQAVVNMLPPNLQARQRMEDALDRADIVLSEGRDRVRDLRSPVRGPAALDDALQALGAQLAQNSTTAFSLAVRGDPILLHPVVCDEAYRIGHEALVNAFAHAQARQVVVEIDYGTMMFTLGIRDDGRGIDARYLTPYGRPDHWGLRGMHERARESGGTLQISSQPDAGSDVRLRVKATLAYRSQA
ncbi:histidine kinase [Pigmentiphaga aceris]|uniref:Histidine kinase n=1 Tax=Pigmentiphaga aceris TaxID=1940612 RepID=A0A5C0B5R7_9BURK|nr:sensor histidine kinase [Pigmentiphaga aceris]QEI09013.1 histidine kinase [Pigmentiphaga aceris]